MADEKTAGTPVEDGGDAKVAAGTPPADDRDASSKEPDYKTMYLESKDKIEEANRIRAERDELKERLEHAPAAPVDEPLEEDEDDLPGVQEWASKQDQVAQGLLKVAKAVKKGRAERAELVKAIIDRDQLRDIPDPVLRKEVYEHYQRNRNRFEDPKSALDNIQARRLQAEKDKLVEENERLKKAVAQAAIKPPDGVPTHLRGAPGSEKDIVKMTRAQWLKDQAELGDDERMAQQTLRRKGLINVVD